MNRSTVIYLKIAFISLVLVIIDQITKYFATVNLKGKNDFQIIKDILVFHYLDGGNTGAAWGMLQGKKVIFILITLIAIIFISILIRNIENIIVNNYSLNVSSLKILQIVFSVLMAGAIGNFIDRIIHGYVIDFIYFKPINFPIFNVADIYVTLSCVILILICIFKIDSNDFNNIFTLKKIKKDD